jgi:hypothetical protein
MLSPTLTSLDVMYGMARRRHVGRTLPSLAFRSQTHRIDRPRMGASMDDQELCGTNCSITLNASRE